LIPTPAERRGWGDGGRETSVADLMGVEHPLYVPDLVGFPNVELDGDLVYHGVRGVGREDGPRTHHSLHPWHERVELKRLEAV